MLVHQRVKSLQRVSFPSEMTSHDIRLKVPAKQTCSKIVRQRKRGGAGRREMEEKSMEDRTAISFLSCFIFFSSSSRDLSRAFSDELTPQDPIPLRKSPALWRTAAPRRRTRIKDSFEVIGRRYFLPSSSFSHFAENATPSLSG